MKELAHVRMEGGKFQLRRCVSWQIPLCVGRAVLSNLELPLVRWFLKSNYFPQGPQMRMQISFTTTLAGLGRWFSRGKCLWHKHTRTWVWICSTYIQTGYGGRNRRVTGPLSRFNEWSCLREIRQGLTEQSTQPPPLAAAHVYPNTCCLPCPHTHTLKKYTRILQILCM